MIDWIKLVVYTTFSALAGCILLWFTIGVVINIIRAFLPPGVLS